MTKNTYIPLDPSSSFRNDAINSIKHTLLLKYEVPHVTSKDQLIPEVMKSCQKCCQGLFIDRAASSDKKISFNFFGSLSSINPSVLENPSHRLSFLDEFPPNKQMYPEMSNIGFPTMILDHCVISCYHAVLTELLGNKTVTAYEMVNDIKSQGIYSLYKKDKLNLQSEPILKKKDLYFKPNSTKSSVASDFGKKAQTHIKVLSSTQPLFKAEGSNDTNGFFLQFADIFSYICNIDARRWKFRSSEISENNRFDILEKFKELSQNLFPDSNIDTVDKLYKCYIIERISNVKLISCLLKNIDIIEKNSKYILCQEEIINTLCLCQKFPNVFSRQYFIQYAFDKLINEPISYLDFWHNHRLDMSTNVLESPLKPVLHFQFVRWLEQFSLFCNYMSEYVIPIYEWCFTNMIMDTIEKNFLPNTGKETAKNEIKHRTNLLTAYEALSEYIQQNSQQIICPVLFDKQPRTLSFVTEAGSNLVFPSIPANTIQQLFQLCFSQEELDLNLCQLNPDFFLNSGKKPNSKNFSHIRNFYINLLYPG